MEEKDIMENESLSIITEMINKTRRNVMDGNVFICLGSVLTVICFVFCALVAKLDSVYLVYACLVSTFLWNNATIYFVRKAIFRSGSAFTYSNSALTYSDEMVKTVWQEISVLGFSCKVTVLILLCFFEDQVLNYVWAVPFAEALLIYLGSVVTARVVQMKSSAVDYMSLGMTAFWAVFISAIDVETPYNFFSVALLMQGMVSIFSMVYLGIWLRRNQKQNN